VDVLGGITPVACKSMLVKPAEANATIFYQVMHDPTRPHPPPLDLVGPGRFVLLWRPLLSPGGSA
jgi:hypothetical protein